MIGSIRGNVAIAALLGIAAAASVMSVGPSRADRSSLAKIGGDVNNECANVKTCDTTSGMCTGTPKYISSCTGKTGFTCYIDDKGGDSPCGSNSACNSQTGGTYDTPCS